MNAPAVVIETVLEAALTRPATLGVGRLVCVDGPSGAGKTTLALDLAGRVPGARVVHTDELVPGWTGLAELETVLEHLLLPLAEGRAGSYRRYDWRAGELAETVEVGPSPLLLLEGVGSGAARFSDLHTVLAWVEAPAALRLQRGLDRDGDAFAPHWEQWARDEAALFARERTRERADLVVDGAVAWG